MAPLDTTTGSARPSDVPTENCKRAYVTFLAGDGDYIKGVQGLMKGLRRVKAAYPLLVAVLSDVPESHRQLLRAEGCIVREIEGILPAGYEQCEFAMAYYVINYSKLRIWQFQEYERMIYLDADIMVYENIDHLFDLPDDKFYAVMDCFCEISWRNTLQYKVKYCQQSPEKNPWPEHLGEPPAIYFNAGMFVFSPSMQTFNGMMVALSNSVPTHFAEQDFLNKFFHKIFQPIPPVYNLVMAMLWRHPEKIDLEKIKVVHYCAQGSKPWKYDERMPNMDRDDVKMLVKKWRDVVNETPANPLKKEPYVHLSNVAGDAFYLREKAPSSLSGLPSAA